jgi:SPP1 family predicted phage head-tail adaptor
MTDRLYTAAQLDQRVRFQRRDETRNGLNEKVGQWVNDGDLRMACVKPIASTEVAAAGSRQSRFRATVVIRYSATRTAEQILAQGLRLVWKGRLLDIQGAFEVDSRQEWTAMDVVEGVRDGKA